MIQFHQTHWYSVCNVLPWSIVIQTAHRSYTAQKQKTDQDQDQDQAIINGMLSENTNCIERLSQNLFFNSLAIKVLVVLIF